MELFAKKNEFDLLTSSDTDLARIMVTQNLTGFWIMYNYSIKFINI